MKITLNTQIKYKNHKFEAESPLLILDNQTLMLLELCGSDSAIRAIWANIVKGRKAEGTATDVKYQVDGDENVLYIEEKGKYLSKSFPGRMLIMSKAFAEKDRSAFIGGSYTEPPIHFIDAFKMAMQKIPFLRTWEYEFWKMGLEIGGIRPLTVYSNTNIGAWKIYERADWNTAIKEAILNGTISGN